MRAVVHETFGEPEDVRSDQGAQEQLDDHDRDYQTDMEPARSRRQDRRRGRGYEHEQERGRVVHPA